MLYTNYLQVQKVRLILWVITRSKSIFWNRVAWKNSIIALQKDVGVELLTFSFADIWMLTLVWYGRQMFEHSNTLLNMDVLILVYKVWMMEK